MGRTFGGPPGVVSEMTGSPAPKRKNTGVWIQYGETKFLLKPLLGVLSCLLRSCKDARGTPLCLTSLSDSRVAQAHRTVSFLLFSQVQTMGDNLDAFMKGLEFARTSQSGLPPLHLRYTV